MGTDAGRHRTARTGPGHGRPLTHAGNARRRPAYHPRVSWLALAVAALAFALALLPTRRLFMAGWRPVPLAAYLVVLMSLAIVLVLFRAGIRVLLPILLVLYVAPFVGAPEILSRTITRLGPGRGGRGGPVVIDGVSRPSTSDPGPGETGPVGAPRPPGQDPPPAPPSSPGAGA